MKFVCPSCGRSTSIDPDLGDFPTRCQRCNSLLRRPAPAKTQGALSQDRLLDFGTGDSPAAAVAPAISAGGLAGLLTTRPPRPQPRPRRTPDDLPTLHAQGAAVMPQPSISSPRAPVDSPPDAREATLDLARVEARQKAMRRAQLRSNHFTLGALNTLGFALIAIIAVSAVALGAKSLWPSPQKAHGATVENLPAQQSTRAVGAETLPAHR